MLETMHFVMALSAGSAIGSVFFGGLWWTVRRALSSRRPAFLFVVSLMLRSSIAVGGLYIVARGDWRQLPISLFGFLLARTVVLRMTRLPPRSTPAAFERSLP
jgi:F1F0 ATPase subunit 2